MEINFPIDIRHKLLTAFRKVSPISKHRPSVPDLKKNPPRIHNKHSVPEIPVFSSLSPVFRKTLDENLELRRNSPLTEYSPLRAPSTSRSKGMNLETLSISPILMHTRYKTQPASRRRITRIKSQANTFNSATRGSAEIAQRSFSPIDTSRSTRCVNFPTLVLEKPKNPRKNLIGNEELSKFLMMNSKFQDDISPSDELRQTQNVLDLLKKELREISGISTERSHRNQTEVHNARFRRIGKAYSQKDIRYYKKFMKLHGSE
jgi:hypothetical protein